MRTTAAAAGPAGLRRWRREASGPLQAPRGAPHRVRRGDDLGAEYSAADEPRVSTLESRDRDGCVRGGRLDSDDTIPYSPLMQSPHAPLIRALRAEDLPDALGLSTAAGWNQQIADWTTLRALAGDGAFAAVSGPRVVGTALAIDYGPFAWIAMMLVTPAWRGQGLGRRLLEAALRTVPDGRPVRLDATEAGRPLYRSHGFVDEGTLTRLVAPADRPVVATTASVAVRFIAPADLPAITRRDAEVFGGDRRTVLEWAPRAAPQYALIVDDVRRPPQVLFWQNGQALRSAWADRGGRRRGGGGAGRRRAGRGRGTTGGRGCLRRPAGVRPVARRGRLCGRAAAVPDVPSVRAAFRQRAHAAGATGIRDLRTGLRMSRHDLSGMAIPPRRETD